MRATTTGSASSARPSSSHSKRTQKSRGSPPRPKANGQNSPQKTLFQKSSRIFDATSGVFPYLMKVRTQKWVHLTDKRRPMSKTARAKSRPRSTKSDFSRRNSNFILAEFNSRMFQVIALRFAVKSEPKTLLIIPFNVRILRKVENTSFHWKI